MYVINQSVHDFYILDSSNTLELYWVGFCELSDCCHCFSLIKRFFEEVKLLVVGLDDPSPSTWPAQTIGG